MSISNIMAHARDLLSLPSSHSEMYNSLLSRCPLVLHNSRKKFSSLELYFGTHYSSLSIASLSPFSNFYFIFHTEQNIPASQVGQRH